MDWDAVDVRLAALARALGEAVEILEQWDEKHWAEWLRTSWRRIDAGDVSGLDHLLMAYGAMGSINDVAVRRVNGHRIDPADEQSVNEHLSTVLRAVWTEATALQKILRLGEA